jgi:2-iminobutanoate/2-iminopropanoate deaminase
MTALPQPEKIDGQRSDPRRTLDDLSGTGEGARLRRHGDTVYVSGLPPFDPETGSVVVDATVERQAELVLEQLKLCVETAGSSLDQVLKCNVYCTSADKFAAVNAIYDRYFPTNPPARIFVCVPQWFGRFDIEIDCIAAV